MKYTDEQLLKLHPELDAIFKKHGIPKLATPTRETVPTFRKFYSRTSKRYNESALAKAALGEAFNKPDWTERDHDVDVRRNRTTKVRTYTPNTLPQGGAGVFVMIHGGGWFMGDLDTEAMWCRLLASKLGLVAVNVDYGLYPDVEFGVPATDCYYAVKWVAANASSFGGDPRKAFIVGGNSGGGTYATVACHLARDDKLDPPLTGCFLACPILTDEHADVNGETITRWDHTKEYRSWTQNAEAPLMSDKMRQSIRDLADFDGNANSVLLTPFNFQSQKDVPPTYIQVCGLDPWRDGGILYSDELNKFGITTKVDVYPGLPHCWWTTFPQLKVTQSWLNDSIEGVRWLLKNGNTNETAKL